MRGKLLTFGEALFRFSTNRGERLRDARAVDFYLGGSELNVAVNYASLGGEATWLSVVAEGAAGDLILERLQNTGVDLSRLKRKGNSLGFYLVEDSLAPRSSRVPVRQKSSLADCIAGAFDWKRELSNAWVFHSSGITAGLGTDSRAELLTAMQTARSQSVLVSYDCNYRRNLWSEQEAKNGQKDLLPLADILFCSMADLELFYGVTPASLEGFVRESGIKYLVMSQRNAESTYGIDVFTARTRISSQRIQYQITDQIGVGDSMTAGFFSALRSTEDVQKIADFAAASGALKYSIRGDMALLKKDEVDQLLAQGHRSILR